MHASIYTHVPECVWRPEVVILDCSLHFLSLGLSLNLEFTGSVRLTDQRALGIHRLLLPRVNATPSTLAALSSPGPFSSVPEFVPSSHSQNSLFPLDHGKGGKITLQRETFEGGGLSLRVLLPSALICRSE